MKVTGTIRKLNDAMANHAEIKKTHVLFVQKPDGFYSFLVNDDIIEGNVTNNEDFSTTKNSLEEIVINEEASAKSRKGDRTFVEGTMKDLLAQELSKTFTDDHSSYQA